MRRATEHDLTLSAARLAHAMAATLNALETQGHGIRSRDALRSRMRKFSGLVRQHGAVWQPSAVGVIGLVNEVFGDCEVDVAYDPQLEGFQ